MTSLDIVASTNFRTGTLLDITAINFTNLIDPAAAVFNGSQFDDIQITTSVAIAGSSAVNEIVGFGPNVDASLWSFTDWGSDDRIVLFGTQGADGLIGTSQRDEIRGNSGADTLDGMGGPDILFGGQGDDTLLSFDSNGGDELREIE